MTIRELVMASMMALVLGGCSVSFMGTPTSSAPGNNYGYGWAGKPIASVDDGQTGKSVHPGSAPSANDDSPPTAEPPARPPQRTKPAPHRTKPTQPGDTRPDPTDTPTRRPVDPGSVDKPPTRRPIDPGSVDKPPTRRPADPGSVDKPPARRPVGPVPTKPDAPQRTPQPKPVPTKRDGVTMLDAHRAVLHRAPTR